MCQDIALTMDAGWALYVIASDRRFDTCAEV